LAIENPVTKRTPQAARDPSRCLHSTLYSRSMSIAKEMLQTDLRYSAWATGCLLEACGSLDEADRVRDLRVSHGSVVETLHHVFVSERFWCECLLADRIPPLDEIGAEPPPRGLELAKLQREWPAVWNGLERWLASLSEQDLAHVLRCRLSADRTFDFTRWQLLRHSLNHASLHRGQVVGMLRALGKQPPNVDVMSYLLK